jgi:hypothetical protein
MFVQAVSTLIKPLYFSRGLCVGIVSGPPTGRRLFITEMMRRWHDTTNAIAVIYQ